MKTKMPYPRKRKPPVKGKLFKREVSEPHTLTDLTLAVSCAELCQATVSGPCPDRGLTATMVVADTNVGQRERKIEVGVNFQSVWLEQSDGLATLFPCKFSDNQELFILVHCNAKFTFKGEECWIKIEAGQPVSEVIERLSSTVWRRRVKDPAAGALRSSESPATKETGVRNLHPFADIAKL